MLLANGFLKEEDMEFFRVRLPNGDTMSLVIALFGNYLHCW